MKDSILAKEILCLIEKDCRTSNKQIATMIGVEESVVETTIKDLESENIILGYNSLINWDKTDKEFVTALIEVKVSPQRGEGFDKIAERISKFPEVKSVYLMSGGFDLTVILEGKTLKEAAFFVSEKLSPLPSVISTATSFVLKKYKDNGISFEEKQQDTREVVSP